MGLPEPFTQSDPLHQVVGLTDARLIQLHVQEISGQLHGVRSKLLKDFPLLGGYRLPVLDLSNAIGDIVIETSAQGASLLEVHIVDPWWELMESRFIDTTDDGWLIPLDLTFPVGTTQQWRLVACNPSTDYSAANLVLTFEDKIVSEMRTHLGPVQSTAGELLHSFIGQLVKQGAPDATFVFHLVDEAADENQVNQQLQAQNQGGPADRHAGGTGTGTSSYNKAFNKAFNQGYRDALAGKPQKVSFNAGQDATNPSAAGYVSGYTAGVLAPTVTAAGSQGIPLDAAAVLSGFPILSPTAPNLP